MSDERTRRMMQRALDEELTPEMRQRLQQRLEENPDASAEMRRLEQVDAVLRAAPLERAPQRLALKIIARLAETVKAQTGVSSEALALALTLVGLVAMPLLTIAAWAALNALANAALLAQVIQQMMSLLNVFIGALVDMVQQAQGALQTNPEIAGAALGLVALAAAGVAGYVVYRSRSEK